MLDLQLVLLKKKKLLKKENIKNNDIILAIPSSGLHSNGFSLIRQILKKKKLNINKHKYKNEFIKPTKIYVKEILNLTKKNLVHGCANITGGGIIDNLVRVLPHNLKANIDLNKIKVHDIFKWIKSQGIEENEMLKTFNCGVGFCLILKKKNIKKIQKYFNKNYKPYVIGYISKGKNKLNKYGNINW